MSGNPATSYTAERFVLFEALKRILTPNNYLIVSDSVSSLQSRSSKALL